MAKRHKFSREELDGYFDRICLPAQTRVYDANTLDDHEKLEFLAVLCKHHLCKVPWENIVQHYSWHRAVHLSPIVMYRTIVEQSGRGGYCMTVNFCFHMILYSLGFQVYMAGSRICLGDSYGGWTHVVNLVTIAGTRYLLDGGFGPQGRVVPVPVVHGRMSTQISPAQMRLVHEPIGDNLDQTQKVWIYQHRYDESKDWVSMYCFVDLEFTPADVESMNFAPWLNKQSFFTHKVVCVRFTTDREAQSPDGPGSPGEWALEGTVDGSLSLSQNTLKWRRHGEKVMSLQFNKEEERVAALKKYFGIHISEEDQNAILGTAGAVASQNWNVLD